MKTETLEALSVHDPECWEPFAQALFQGPPEELTVAERKSVRDALTRLLSYASIRESTALVDQAKPGSSLARSAPSIRATATAMKDWVSTNPRASAALAALPAKTTGEPGPKTIRAFVRRASGALKRKRAGKQVAM